MSRNIMWAIYSFAHHAGAKCYCEYRKNQDEFKDRFHGSMFSY